MKIGICNDHAGVDYKFDLVKHLTDKGYEMVNFGTGADVAAPGAADSRRLETTIVRSTIR